MDNEKCRVLIKLHGAKEFLWNSKSPIYHNKSLRKDARNENKFSYAFTCSRTQEKNFFFFYNAIHHDESGSCT
jgi:hypothetical protein